MRTAIVFFTIVLVAHVVYAGRIIRDAPEAPEKTFTLEDVNKMVETFYSSVKAEVEKVATKENLEKVQDALKGAIQTAQKGLEELKSKADEALKSSSSS